MHQEFMRRAIALAQAGMDSNDGGPFGCVIVKNDQIVAEGNNRVTSTNDPTAHAEVVAIRRACEALGSFQLEGCTVYTSCEPCPMCLGALYWARPDKIYYACTQQDAARIGFDDRFIYNEIEKSQSDRNIPFQQLLQGEAVKVFDRWTEKEDRKAY